MTSADELKLLRNLPADAFERNLDDTQILRKAAQVLEDCGQRLKTVTGNLGMTGASAEAAIDHFVRLTHTTLGHVDTLNGVVDMGTAAHAAMVTAKTALDALPPADVTTAEKVAIVGTDTAKAGVVGVIAGVLQVNALVDQRAQAHEAAADKALTTLNLTMAYAQSGLPSVAPGYCVDPFGQRLGGDDTTAVAPAALNAPVGGSVRSYSGMTGSGSSHSASHSASGISAGAGASHLRTSGAAGANSGTSGAASADGSMAGYVPGAHSASGVGISGGISGVNGLGGSGSGGGGALAGGLMAGGIGLGAVGLSRAGGLGSGMGAGGMSGGIGSSLGVGAAGSSSNGMGAGSRGGLEGTAGSRGSASGTGVGSEEGGAAGSQAGGAKGGMPMGGSGAGGAGKEKGRRNSAGYLVPNLNIADDQAVVDLGAGAKAGSRAQLAAERFAPGDDFEPDETW